MLAWTDILIHWFSVSKGKSSKFTLNLTEMKRKGGLYSFFTPKTKATKIENELSKTDLQDEVEGEREDEDEAEGERKDIEGERHDKHEVEVEGEDEDELEAEGEEQKEHEKDDQDEQGQEEVGEHMEEGEDHQREKAMRQDSERQRTGPEPSPATSSRGGPPGMEIVSA